MTPVLFALLAGLGVAVPHRPAAADSDSTVLRLEISIRQRRLFVLAAADTVREFPVAVGSGRTLRGSDRSWTFTTPKGNATVVAKEENPVWIPPDWHYVEIARANRLRLTRLAFGDTVWLKNGRRLTLQEGAVGLLDRDTTFHPLPREEEIVFDGQLFVPPFGSVNRRVENMLGQHRLLLSNGVGLHGTPYQESIGKAATHGCIRLYDEDIQWLYENVPLGAPVIIF